MKPLLALVAIALLTGCAREDAAYPSLAPRAIEGRGFAEPAVAPPAPAAVDPALDARLADWGKRLDAIAKSFNVDAAGAGKAAGSAGARTVGSESWIAAQQALAALDDWRAQAGGLATELDDAARERAATMGAAYPPLDALQTRAQAEAEREGAAIAALGAKVPAP